MVRDQSDIEVLGLLWDYGPDGNVAHLALHDVTPEDVFAVLAHRPLFFQNLPRRKASHVMVGRDGRSRILYIALLESAERGIWAPVTGWESRLARKIYLAER